MARFAEIDTDAMVRLVRSLKDDLDAANRRLAHADAVIARMDALIRSGCLAGCGSNGKVVAHAVAAYVGERE